MSNIPISQFKAQASGLITYLYLDPSPVDFALLLGTPELTVDGMYVYSGDRLLRVAPTSNTYLDEGNVWSLVQNEATWQLTHIPSSSVWAGSISSLVAESGDAGGSASLELHRAAVTQYAIVRREGIPSLWLNVGSQENPWWEEVSLKSGYYENGAYVRAAHETPLNPDGAGIEIVCSAGYIHLFLYGSLYVLDQNGYVRTVYNCFDNFPTVEMDSEHGYIVGSRRVMDGGRTHVCTDATPENAVWAEIPAAPAFTYDLGEIDGNTTLNYANGNDQTALVAGDITLSVVGGERGNRMHCSLITGGIPLTLDLDDVNVSPAAASLLPVDLDPGMLYTVEFIRELGSWSLFDVRGPIPISPP